MINGKMTMINRNTIAKHRANSWASVSTLILGGLVLSACTTTQKAPIERASINCGLLGDVCSQLRPGGKDMER